MSGTFASLPITQANRFAQMYVNGFVDVSGGNVLLRGDAGANHLILQNGDISLNGRLFATRDISLNGNVCKNVEYRWKLECKPIFEQ